MKDFKIFLQPVSVAQRLYIHWVYMAMHTVGVRVTIKIYTLVYVLLLKCILLLKILQTYNVSTNNFIFNDLFFIFV